MKVAPLLERVPDWQEFLSQGVLPAEVQGHERTGRPLGDDGFMARIERLLGRSLARQRPGPKPKKW